MSALDVALECAGRGWPVFPCKADKSPTTQNGHTDADTDPDAIRRLWAGRPGPKVGLATGAAGLVVVDVDVKAGVDGYESLHDLSAALGVDLTDTMLVDTQSGGQHLYYRANGHRVGSTAGKLGPGLDVKAEGGYVIAAGSPGYLYVDGHGPERLRDLPPELAERLAYRKRESTTRAIPKGKRHATLLELAGRLRRLGLTPEAIEAALLKTPCSPPHDPRDIHRIAHDIGQKPGPELVVEQPAAAPTDSGIHLVRLADVPAQAVDWLWAGRIPLGKITLLVGDPGQGKTTVALDIAARVTTGTPFPDGSRPPVGDVVILTAEDGLADTIRPRLDMAGADPRRVWAVQAVRCEGPHAERSFSLTQDVEPLERVLNASEAALVIMDPLDAYLPGTDTHRTGDVRSTLAPFAAMLERTGAAGLCIQHLNKNDGSVNAMYRLSGSLAFVAAARAAHGVAPDRDNEGRYLFLPVKMNLAPKPQGIGYRLENGGVRWDAEPVTVDAATAFAAKPKRADSDKTTEAKTYILAALADGRPVAQAIIEEDAEAAGIALATLRRAKSILAKDGRVRSKREGFGPGGTWFWTLTPDFPGER